MKRGHGSSFSTLYEVGSTETTIQSPTKSRFRGQGLKPFSTEGYHDSTASELCPVCETIDFRNFFSIQASEIPAGGIPVFTLINLHPRLSQTSCLSCTMFASMAFSEFESCDDSAVKYSRSLWHLQAFPATSLCGIPATKALLSQGVTVFISLVLANLSTRITLEQRRDSWKRGIILPTTVMSTDKEVHPGFSAKALEVGPYVQGTRMRDMLDTCLTTHSCDIQKLTFPHNAHVIDCETRAIVQLSKCMEYLALSYV